MDKDSLLFRTFMFLLAAVVLALGSGPLLAWLLEVKPDVASWSLFINAKLPLIWTQTITALLTVFAVNMMTPGSRTISVIMDLNGSKDTWQNRAVACAFLLGMGFIAAITVKGGF